MLSIDENPSFARPMTASRIKFPVGTHSTEAHKDVLDLT